MPSTNVFSKLYTKITFLGYILKKILTGIRNVVYFCLCINLIHITQPVTAEGFDGLSPEVCQMYLSSGEPFPKQALVFTCLQYKSFENNARKEEIACNEQFLLFAQCFLPLSKTFRHFHQTSNCLLQTFSLVASKICRLGKG